MAKRRSRKAAQTGRAGIVIDTVAQVVVDAAGVVTPLPDKAIKELHKLQKRLATARKAESKRLRKLAMVQGSKGRKQVAKRSRQATAAADDVASLASQVWGIAVSAAGSAAASVGDAVSGAARDVGSAAGQAAQAVTPVKAPVRAPRTRRTTTKVSGPVTKQGATATAKPATAKPATAKPTAAKAPTAKPAAAKPRTPRKPRAAASATTRRAPRRVTDADDTAG